MNHSSCNKAAPQVCVLGAGSFGTAISRVVADNLSKINCKYDPVLKLWARRSSVANEINELHENKQYLPGSQLPSNITASSDLVEVLQGCEVVIIGIPSHYLSDDILGEIAEYCGQSGAQQHQRIHLVSLAKGIEFQDGKLLLVSDILSQGVQHPYKSFEVSVLMGANVYDQMGRDEFAEATLGCMSGSPEEAKNLLSIFNDPNRLAVTLTSDRAGVELSGALKNIVSLAAGYSEGLNLGSNTKAAIIRRGLLEIIRFAKTFFHNVQNETFLESSGIADLMTTCFGGRGRYLAAEFIRCKQEKGWNVLEKELLNGQQLPDWHNAQHVYRFLENRQMLDSFPLFNAVYTIGFEKRDPMDIVEALKSENISLPEQENNSSNSATISFNGKRALVTGAGNGIGFAIAELLSELGADVIALDQDLIALEKLKTKINCQIIAVDLIDIESLERKLSVFQSSPPQLLVNCAGIAKFEPFFETDVKTFDITYAVNTKAAIFLTQIVTKQLVDAKLPGSVVHITSQSSTLALRDHLVYSSSKAALDHIARIQALELGKMNIRVNVVRPTVVLTDLALKNWKKEDLDKMSSQVPLGRLAEPIDVARTVCWLLSDQASMITGEAIAVDGGRTMGGFGL